jgi:hypothetical protein
MKMATIMRFHLPCKRVIVGVFLVATTATAGSSGKGIIKSVKTMEQVLGVKMIEPGDLGNRSHATAPSPDDGYAGNAIEVSADGTAVVWSDGTLVSRWLKQIPYRDKECPLFTVENLTEGKQPVFVEGLHPAFALGLSDEGKVIVAIALPLPLLPNTRFKLIAVDRRSGVVIHDLTPFATQIELKAEVYDISVSGPGNLVALGRNDQIQVLEIPGGRSVFAGAGWYPRISPDGKRLAFVDDKDKLWIYSFADGSKIQLLKGKSVKGVGGWSPDGRFLLAGAWTTLFAFSKRQIIIDTTTGEYAVIGKLGEGNYGTQYAWISVELVKQTRAQ